MTTSSRSPALFPPGELGELLHELAEQRALLLITARGVTDAQAAERTTVSGLTLGGIIKHLTRGEVVWTQIMVKGEVTSLVMV
ncbi:mycothiol transferase [Streptomyces sp. SYSU K21746]